MRFKVDENLPPDVVALLREEGHDALSVWDQGLRGAKDPRLAEVCRAERRALLTFDLGFGDIRQYPPHEWPGFVVLRLGSQSRAHVLATFRRILSLLATLPLTGRLWVVTERDVRIRGGEEEHAEAL
jgi:predicted nuclease of predicted toxin-antitoxin system